MRSEDFWFLWFWLGIAASIFATLSIISKATALIKPLGIGVAVRAGAYAALRRLGLVFIGFCALGILAVLYFSSPPLIDTPLSEITLGTLWACIWRMGFAIYLIIAVIRGHPDRNYAAWGKIWLVLLSVIGVTFMWFS